MKKLLFSLVAIIICAAAVAQKKSYSKNDMPFKESRNVGNFTSLNVSSIFNVYISAGDSPVLEIKSTHDMLKYVTTEVIRGELVIKFDRPWNFRGDRDNNRKINIYISKNRLSAIKASGAADIFGKDVLKADNIEITASGSSDIQLNLKVNGMLKCNASGSSDIDLTGEGKQGYVIASGASDIGMKKFCLNTLEAKISGASDADFYVSDSISVRASGASDVTYYGSPEYVNIDKSGSSDVRKGRKR